MELTRCLHLLLLAFTFATTACGSDGEEDSEDPAERDDGAWPLEVDASASLQNPCFVAGDDNLVVTQWLGGYNESPAVVGTVPIDGGALSVLTDPDATSVNLPGACHAAGSDRIVFSSDLGGDHDEIYLLALGGGAPEQVTARSDAMAFEPSLSPDGGWIVFESHPLDVEDQGALYKVRVNGSELTQLSDGSGDDRQPNWSPDGTTILFQSHQRVSGNIDIFVMDVDGGSIRNVTDSIYDDTDASFSPDGSQIVYSSNEGDLELASLFVIAVEGGPPTRVTVSAAYDGAPSWSHDGGLIAFESAFDDPDGSAGTAIYLIDAPGN